MYEIWLVFNIVYEIALTMLPWIGLAAIVWLALFFMGARHLKVRNIKSSLYISIAAGILVFFIAPSATKSSLSNMGYWIDWANLFGIAVAATVIVFFYTFPLICWFRRKPN